jgi:hypothetical protein
MSSVAEMSMLVREVADFAAPSPNWKDRVNAAARVLGLPFGRVKAHYYGEARRVDAEEMDRARATARELRDAKQREREHEHLAWLECEIARHRAAGTDFRGAYGDALEHVLRMARGDAGAVEIPEAVGDLFD